MVIVNFHVTANAMVKNLVIFCFCFLVFLNCGMFLEAVFIHQVLGNAWLFSSLSLPPRWISTAWVVVFVDSVWMFVRKGKQVLLCQPTSVLWESGKITIIQIFVPVFLVTILHSSYGIFLGGKGGEELFCCSSCDKKGFICHNSFW